MKIASYHRMLGDSVTFFKGNLKEFVLDHLTDECLRGLEQADPKRDWKNVRLPIRDFIKTRKQSNWEIISPNNSQEALEFDNEIKKTIKSFADIYRKKDYDNFPKWDRVYVTTLFTFYWKVTVEAIQYAKHLVKDPDQLYVGGVLASLLHNELEKETGIKPHEGLLDTPGMLDPDNVLARDIIIDNLPLDYSILDEIEYKYPTGSAYFTFMTKGCTRKCAFCSVPILEPTYKPKIDTIDKFAAIKERFGEQRHLLLMDNNVLASPNFPEIIAEIKEMGFKKGAMYVEPNQLDIAINNLRENYNDKAYIKRSYNLLHELIRRLKGKKKQDFRNILKNYNLVDFDTTTKASLLACYSEVKDTYEEMRSKFPKQRYVDFNQGTDARYVTEDLMKLMSEIPIRPLRIAFDYWGMRKQYEKAVRLAAKYEIPEMSNYILYNFKDSPEELYKRLEINVKLGEELGLPIYSFPMKYIPLFGEEAKNRYFIGQNWNKKFIRAIQSILNVTKGIVAPGRPFFEKAFGKDLNEFNQILYMPEAYIIYRHFFERSGLTEKWRKLFNSLTGEEKEQVFGIIESNDFSNHNLTSNNKIIIEFLSHYRVRRDDFDKGDPTFKETKDYFEKLIRDDQFKDLTLTYDFEAETITSGRR